MLIQCFHKNIVIEPHIHFKIIVKRVVLFGVEAWVLDIHQAINYCFGNVFLQESSERINEGKN